MAGRGHAGTQLSWTQQLKNREEERWDQQIWGTEVPLDGWPGLRAPCIPRRLVWSWFDGPFSLGFWGRGPSRFHLLQQIHPGRPSALPGSPAFLAPHRGGGDRRVILERCGSVCNCSE